MADRIHVIDPDIRRRARVSRELHDQPLHVEIYEDLDEFLGVAPTEGLILFAHDPERPGGQVRALTQSAQTRLPVIAYAEAPSPKHVVGAMLSGAFGYLEWPFEQQELGAALRRVSVDGEKRLRRQRVLEQATAKVERLSRREKEVLTGLIGGLSNKDIGQALAISSRTVEIHRSHMMMKLGARSVADAVRTGLYAGLDESIP